MAKRTIAYPHGEIGRFKVIKSFQPPPEMLVLRETSKQNTLQARLDFARAIKGIKQEKS